MDKSKHFLFVFILLIFFSKSFGTNIIIKYIINTDSIKTKHLVSDYILRVIKNGWDIVDLSSRQNIPSVKTVLLNTPGKQIIIIKYSIKKDGIYFITDLAGHEVLLDKSMDGDTMVLTLNRIYTIKKKLFYITDSIISPWFYKIIYPAKYKYMGFFDSLAYLHGDVKDGHQYSFVYMNNDLAKYLPIVNNVYSDRIWYYKNFIQNNYMPDKLKYYALKEIQYRYYDDLFTPIEWGRKFLEDYPKEIQDTINSIKNNLNDTDLFENISWYRSIILNYVSLSIKGGSAIDKPDSGYLINRLNYCKSNLTGQVQGYALAYLMLEASRINSKSLFALLYNSYDHKTSTNGINLFVDSLNAMVMQSGNILPEDLLNMSFENSAHNNLSFKTVFNKTIIVIDCWATWCAPCRAQTPAFDSLADKYKNQIQFISISADQFVSKWDNWLSKTRNRSRYVIQLHADKGFEHIFFRRLFINAIPRYLLVSKEGKILNLNMPVPSLAKEFEEQLKKYIQRQ